MSSIRQFDAYARTMEAFRVRTESGGIVTLLSSLLIIFLLVSEWIDFTTIEIHSRLEVDKGRKQMMDIFLNITFPYMPCAILSLDVMDVSGAHQNEISHDVWKVRLDPSGVAVNVKAEKESVSSTTNGDPNDKNYCGSCYGAKEGCCNTCREVQDAYAAIQWSFKDAETMDQCVREGYIKAMKEQEKEGCNINGKISVNKVPGNFHFAPGRSYEQSSYHIHDISAIPKRNFDFSYKIHYLSFGINLPGIINPLDDVSQIMAHDKMFMVQKFIKVVGTKMSFLNGSVLDTNQFSVNEFTKDVTEDVTQRQSTIPGLFFHYEISPMLVIKSETKKSFAYFITSLCAVVGGVFTVAGLIDAGVHRTIRAIQRKAELGKLG